MIGRSERAAPEIEGYWEKGSTFPNFLYRCSDGELIQVWFGGKGMYPKLIEVLGDEPSTAGYYSDQATGALGVRAKRWTSLFAVQPRDYWIERLRQVGVACEPVLAPGEALADPHVAEIGLAMPRSETGSSDVVVATPISVLPLADSADEESQPCRARPGATGRGIGPAGRRTGARLLRLRRRAVGGPGVGGPRRRRHQGRAARRGGDARRGLRRGRVSTAQAQPRARHHGTGVPPGGRAAHPLGRRRAPQLPGRRGGTAGHRRGRRQPAEPAGCLLPRQRFRQHRPAGQAARQRRSHASVDGVGAGDRGSGQRAHRRHLDSPRHDRRLGGGDRHPGRAVCPARSRAPGSACSPACSAPECSCRAPSSNATARLVQAACDWKRIRPATAPGTGYTKERTAPGSPW